MCVMCVCNYTHFKHVSAIGSSMRMSDWTRCYGPPCIVFIFPTRILCRGVSGTWIKHFLVELVLGKTILDKLVWEWRKSVLYHMTTIIIDDKNSRYIFPPNCFSLSYFYFYLWGHMQWNACIRWRLYLPLSFFCKYQLFIFLFRRLGEYLYFISSLSSNQKYDSSALFMARKLNDGIPWIFYYVLVVFS